MVRKLEANEEGIPISSDNPSAIDTTPGIALEVQQHPTSNIEKLLQPQIGAFYPEWMAGWQTQPLLSRQDAQYNWIPISPQRRTDFALHHKWSGGNGTFGTSACETLQFMPRTNVLPGPRSSSLIWTNDEHENGMSTSNSQNPSNSSSSIPKVFSGQFHEPSPRHDDLPIRKTLSSPVLTPMASRRTDDTEQGSSKGIAGTERTTRSNSPTPSQESGRSIGCVEVPASFAPDQSVSPRTTTVQIPQKPTQQRMTYQSARSMIPTPPTSPYRSIYSRAVEKQPTSHPQQPQVSFTDATLYSTSGQRLTLQARQIGSDMSRRPSLYKIPAWSPPNKGTEGGSVEALVEGCDDRTPKQPPNHIQQASFNCQTLSDTAPLQRNNSRTEAFARDAMPSSTNGTSPGHRVPRKFPPNL